MSNQSLPYTAVVLAGGSANDPLLKEANVSSKALLNFQGKPLGRYVLEAIQESKCIKHCVYMGEIIPDMEHLVSSHLSPESDYAGNVLKGIRHAIEHYDAKRIMIVSSDLPWLKTEEIDSFIATAPQADLIYPVINKFDSLKDFPELKRTYAKLKEGHFTGGNLVLVEAEVVGRLEPFIRRIYNARTSPLKLATILGIPFTLRFLLGQLNLSDVENHITKLLALDVKAVPTPFASIAADIDKPEHLNSSSTSASS